MLGELSMISFMDSFLIFIFSRIEKNSENFQSVKIEIKRGHLISKLFTTVFYDDLKFDDNNKLKTEKFERNM